MLVLNLLSLLQLPAKVQNIEPRMYIAVVHKTYRQLSLYSEVFSTENTVLDFYCYIVI